MARQATPKIVTLLDDVEKCEKELVETLMHIPEGKPLQVIINSGGGSVYASLGIATMLRLRDFESEATVLADCSSSALLVFAACKTRKVAPHASFLFHQMKWTSEDHARLTAARSWAKEFARVNSVCEDWLVENLPMERRILRRWMREERYVSAQELYDLGIAEPLELPENHVIDITPRSRKKQSRRRRPAAKTEKFRRVG